MEARFGRRSPPRAAPADEDVPLATRRWRPLSQLRAFEPRPPAAWRSYPRAVGEAVEVSWAPDGHPAAKWEANVISTGRRALVRYVGFEAGWDEWLAHNSPRLFPARRAAAGPFEEDRMFAR